MPSRKGVMPKKFEAHQQNVKTHQARVMSSHDIKNGDECSDIKVMLPSAEPTDMLCKLLAVQVVQCCASELQMLTRNVLMVMSWNIITSWHYSEKSLRVRLKIQEAD